MGGSRSKAGVAIASPGGQGPIASAGLGQCGAGGPVDRPVHAATAHQRVASVPRERRARMIWRINFRRTVRWKNERSFLTAVPRAWRDEGINKLSLAATLVGIDIPRGSRLRELKPYALGGLLTDRTTSPARINDWTRNVGGELKYGLTRGLTLNLTVNTDFAQVESDEQQVNLTRFSLFFPEKREFFLEGQGFSRLRVARANLTTLPCCSSAGASGCNGNEAVRIHGGARVSGRAGSTPIGLLSIRQDDADGGSLPATTFSVMRVKRDIQRRSTIECHPGPPVGVARGPGRQPCRGCGRESMADAGDSTSRLLRADESADGSTGDSYRAQLEYTGDGFGSVFDYLVVDPDFAPEAGYVRRRICDAPTAVSATRSGRRQSPLIRNHEYVAELSYFTDTQGRIQNREGQLSYELNFNTGDDIELQYTRGFERLDQGFTVADAAFIPAGDYTAQELGAAYRFWPQRRASGELSAMRGSFYRGSRTAFEAQGRVEITSRVSLEPRVELNWIDLEATAFRTTLAGSRLNFTATPRMLVAALLQYQLDKRFVRHECAVPMGIHARQ